MFYMLFCCLCLIEAWSLPGDWSRLGLARGELQRASTGEMGGAIMLLLCLAAPPTRPVPALSSFLNCCRGVKEGSKEVGEVGSKEVGEVGSKEVGEDELGSRSR